MHRGLSLTIMRTFAIGLTKHTDAGSESQKKGGNSKQLHDDCVCTRFFCAGKTVAMRERSNFNCQDRGAEMLQKRLTVATSQSEGGSRRSIVPRPIVSPRTCMTIPKGSPLVPVVAGLCCCVYASLLSL